MNILLVEDDKVKARTLTRLITKLVLQEGDSLTHVKDYLGVYNLLLPAELGRIAGDDVPQPFDAIVTDWCFPDGMTQDHGPPIKGNGQHVVTWANKLHVPVIVASGDDRPVGFEGEWAADWSTDVVPFLQRVRVGQ